MKKMEKKNLNAKKRTVLGRKVKVLRKEGMLPANVYGKNLKSMAVSINGEDFKKLYEEVGETGIVNLTIEGEKEPKSVMITNLQEDPVTGDFLHTDFHQVSLTEKITAKIPVELLGEAPAVKDNKGVLLTILNEIEVEALPMDLPENITVDVSKLAELNQEVKVKDLSLSNKVNVLTNKELVVCKIGALMKEEVVEKPVEVVPAEGVAAAVPGEEAGAKPAEEQKPKEEVKK